MKYRGNIFDDLFEMAKKQDRIFKARTIAAITHKDLPNGIIVSSNLNKTHTKAQLWGRNKQAVYLHAELAVTIKALRYVYNDNLKKADLFVMRAKKTNDYCDSSWIYGLSKPCRGCQSLIDSIGFKTVWYSDEPNIIRKI